MMNNVARAEDVVTDLRARGMYWNVRLARPMPINCATLPRSDLGLTRRQAEVLRLTLDGEPNKAISRILEISEGTVKVHIASLFKRFAVRNRAALNRVIAERVGMPTLSSFVDLPEGE
jgi:DNA-binding NarL/FixJ family response regulator